MLQRTSLASPGSPRYGHGMSSNAAPSAAAALLRLWVLAALGMAALHAWQGWQLGDWPADVPGPQPWRTAGIAGLMYLFLLVPAAMVVGLRWRASRDRWLAGLALAHAALCLWSLVSWDAAHENGAALAGTLRRLHMADAAIALSAIPLALRALRQP